MKIYHGIIPGSTVDDTPGDLLVICNDNGEVISGESFKCYHDYVSALNLTLLLAKAASANKINAFPVEGEVRELITDLEYAGAVFDVVYENTG